MKAPNDQVIQDLQTSAQLMAHLAGQFQVDVRLLHAMGLGWLQKRFKKFYKLSEDQLREFIDRILYYGEDPEYDAGKSSGAASVSEILQRARDLVYAAHEEFSGFRKAALEASGDYTTDVFEHAIGDLECMAYKLERELALIKTLGEPGYIGARLEDE